MNKQLLTIYSHIVEELKLKENPLVAKNDLVYFKKEGYKSYGLRTPEVRKVFKSVKIATKTLSKSDIFELALGLYESQISEQATIATSLLNQHIEEITPEDFPILSQMVDLFNNWGTVDDFCLNVLQPLLLKCSRETLILLEEWNKSTNMWKRRASVVTFVRKIGESGKFTANILKLCENLVHDEEDLVLKAVGWCLKDNMRGNRKMIENYIVDLRSRGISSIVTLYALRDLQSSEKEKFISTKAKRGY